MKNIFYNVIKNENQFSQLLVNLLKVDKDINKIIQKFFFENEEREFDLIHTQLRFEGGQPDIIFQFKDGRKAIVEVKTQDSTLTSNQPEGYVSLLAREKNIELFFLIPKYYNHEADIRSRFDLIKDKGGVTLHIKYWNVLVEKINELNIKTDLTQALIYHLNEKFGYQNIKFTKTEIVYMANKEIPNKILELNKAVNSLAKSFAFKGIIWDNQIDSGYGDGYGFWYKNIIWVGYWFELWAEKGAQLILMVNQNVVDELIFNYFESFFKDAEVEIYNSIYKFINVIKWDTEKIKIQVDEFTKVQS